MAQLVAAKVVAEMVGLPTRCTDMPMVDNGVKRGSSCCCTTGPFVGHSWFRIGYSLVVASVEVMVVW